LVYVDDISILGRSVHTVKRNTETLERQLGRPRSRREDEMDLQAVRCKDIDWIEVAQDRDRWRTLVNAVMNLRVP